ncbi:MAG: hypothetical protein AAGM22_16775 [Acidobacteriota bacterium]
MQADQLVLRLGPELTELPLPIGSEDPEFSSIPAETRVLAYLPDDRLLAVNGIESEEGSLLGLRLVEIHADGTATDIGEIAQPDVGFRWQEALDLVVDSDGRLFLLASAFFSNPPTTGIQLVALDPTDAAVLSNRSLDRDVSWLATAPSGLWAKSENGLELLDPDSGRFTFVQGQGVETALDGETDSTGALWLFDSPGFCSPPCTMYWRLDPATGSITERISFLVPSLIPRDMTIRRTCQCSPTRLCLQGGRFLAEVSWRDFSNRRGDGVIAAARSTDSGLFWFFDPANWEVAVKVLNGCGANNNFWVFASGSTNVEYTLKVTDLETGEEQIYENSLGRTAVTVTDTTAFACD